MCRAALLVALLLTAASTYGKTGNAGLPHYQVKAAVTPADGSLSADVTITLPNSHWNGEADFLLSSTFQVLSADAGKDATVTTDRTDWPMKGMNRVSVRRKAPLEKDLRIRLQYKGPLGPSGDPPLNVITPELVELNLDSFWLPIKVGFTTKFTAQAEIRGVPGELVAVAPGKVRRSGDRIVIERVTGDIDLAFAAMRGLKCEGSEVFEFCAASTAPAAAATYRKHGPEAVAYLERWFGPMPGRPARVVMVRRKRSSGYARPGYVVLTEAGGTANIGSAKFIAHEFAHAWWSSGDPTTEHRWLSESIAEYVALRYVEHALGVEARDELVTKLQEIAVKAGPLLGHGVRGDVELYNKGPLLLMRLESAIGRTNMDALLARVAKEQPRVTSDFLRVLSAMAGPEAASRFEADLRK